MIRLLSLFISILLFFSLFSQNENVKYFEGEVIVKIKSKYGQKCNKSSISIPTLTPIIEKNGIYQTQKLFPNHRAPKEKNQKLGWVDLSTIYKFKFNKNTNPKKVINQLLKEESVEYAELNFENDLVFSPNDTSSSKQWYLDAIEAQKAWDIEKGDTTVFIAIIDTGSDLDHEDLVDDFIYNDDDPINGVDDDGDGYIDNYYGWDAANNDNNPNLSNSGHGMNCAGIASATTNNITGISGVGFNTKILTVRIDEESTGRLIGAYQGVVYAADFGAFIISNSWGSNSYSQFAQDVINYAAINKKALVIAAVGNFGEEKRFYPAAYENTLSVGATIQKDTVKANSNFGYWIDIMAPGEDMYTTGANNSYRNNGGTSMAAPVVAGVAALVKSKFPDFTAEQVKEQILNSADDIEAINDQKYINKLGVGRVNAFKAVNQTNLPGIVFENILFTDSDDDSFLAEDELKISGDFTNYLTEANNVSVSIREMNNKFELISSTIPLGNLKSNETKSIEGSPFIVRIKEGLIFNDVLEIQVLIEADNYQKKQYFSLSVNPDYLTVRENKLTFTITSNGGIGFSGDNNELGEGIKFMNGNSLLFEGGFIVGNSKDYIPNRFRGDNTSDKDFSVSQNIDKDIALKADLEFTSIFNDNNHVNGGKLEVLQKNYFFNNSINDQTVIYVYAIRNRSNLLIEKLYAGLFTDWDIFNFNRNKVDYDASRKLGIAYSTDTALYCGVKVLTDSINSTHYAIDNTTDHGGGIEVFGGFSDEEKFQVISSNKEEAGLASAEGNDIIDANAVGPFDLNPNETKQIAFAIIISNSLSSLQQKADDAQKVFDEKNLSDVFFKILPSIDGAKVYPNPTNDLVNIEFSVDQSKVIELSIFDSFGKLVINRSFTTTNSGIQTLQLNTISLKTGVYFLELKGDKLNIQNKFVVSP